MSDRAKFIAKIGAGAAVLAVTLVTGWEGYSARVSRDPIGRLQACYGHDDQTMTLGQQYSPAECRAFLDTDLLVHAGVLDCIAWPPRGTLTDGEKAALVSFAYNVGVPKACGSTFVRRLNAGEGTAACAELDRWVFAGGKDCRIKSNNCIGIVNRRAAERKVCES